MSAGPKRLGKYELQEVLGRGGMAEVWKGFDPQLKRYVAIKFMHTNLRSDPDFMNRFLREGQAIAALRHPNIVQVYDFQVGSSEDENPMAYMVMDYIEGPTLADYVRSTSYAHKFPTADEIVQLFSSISLAVDYAHSRRMIHRDIKPANILLDTRNTVHNPMGEPVLTDFGIVKMMGTATMTATGTSMGTPIYIAPEQVQGQPGNERSDIYSLGVMLYEICTGEPPYRGDTPYAIMAQHVNNTPPPPSQRNPHISKALDAVILRSLARDPQARFPSASAMTVALAEAFEVPVPDQVRQAALSAQGRADGRVGNPSSQSGTPARGLSLSGIPDAVETLPASDSSATDMATLVSANNDTPDSTVAPGRTMGAVPPTPRLAVGPITPLPPSELPGASPVSALPPSSQQFPRKRSRRTLFIGSIVLLILLLGASLGAYFLARDSGNSGTSSAIVGTAAFVSSGQLDANGMPGRNDGLQVRLQNVSPPAPGNQYYAWLQNSQPEGLATYLGTLKLNQSLATLSYSDGQHRDLLAFTSNFLVTEEPANVVPNNPSPDKTKWRYSASLPQTPSSVDHFSYLDHIRHLLTGDAVLNNLGLKGGVDYWLLNNVQEMQKNTMEARDHSNPAEVRQLVVDIVYYLDGKCAPQELKNAGVTLGPENSGIAHASTVSLLDCAQLPDPPAYLTHVGTHLKGIAYAPAVTAQQQNRAIQINGDLNNIKAWLLQVHSDALKLVAMNDTQLMQAQNLRDDMATQAGYVMGGHVDPTTQTLEPGVGEICDSITLLASFEVKAYSA
jgi:serine/threonine protein kinase